MSQLGSSTAFAHDCNTLTKSVPIAAQLTCGARYFDVRPVISAGKFLTGHYSEVHQLNSWQGGNGESIMSIVRDLNGLTAHNKELVILRLSHDLNTDVGNSSYRPLTQSEWTDLLQQLQGIRYLFVAPSTAPADLSQLRLDDFIGGHRAAQQLQRWQRHGKRAAGQAAQERPTPDSPLFLLSWTLTQNEWQASTCAAGASSIKDLAGIANPQLYSRLLAGCNAQCYPNILYMDYIQVPDVTAMAMAVNWLSLA